MNKVDLDRSNVTGEVLVERAAALVPVLRERAADAEKARRIPDATIKDLEDAGLFKAVVPKLYGGHEVGYRYVPQIFRELGRGCTSTSWAMGFLIYHNFQVAHFPEQAQKDAWDERGFARCPGQIMPMGEAVPVDGGYRLTGMWPYGTGIHHAHFMLVSAPVAGSGEPAEIRRFMVDAKDVTILDTWHVSAMVATGSDNVELHDVFVPEHRSVNVADFREGKAPGLAVNTGRFWKIPMIAYLTLGCTGTLVGAAEAMLEMVTEILKTKVGAYSGAQFHKQMSTRVKVARCKARLEATRRYFDAKGVWIEETIMGGGTLSREDRAEIRMACSYIAQECCEIVDILAQAAGSRGKFLDSPIQRFQRDASSLGTHALFDFDHTADVYGGVMMGVEPPANAMI